MAKRKRYDDVMLLAPGETVPGQLSTYHVEHVVGTGAFGAVYFARDPQVPGRQVALKEFFPARHPREQKNLQALFDRECAVGLQAGVHPLMPTFYEAFIHDQYFYIAQEFIEGATLDDIIRKRHPLPREWILKWAVSLCDALAFLHSRQVVHHDLKPANIRITPQGHLALLDFGAAQFFGDAAQDAKPLELYGTEGYLPPELEADGQWVADVRTDIFAVGAILYEMIAGIAPDQESINERSMYVTNSLLQRPNADLGMVKLINRALSYNTEYRFASANDFLLAMRAIAPPVLLVTRKHLRWGDVQSGHAPPPQQVTLYNAGGGEIRGEIKARAPWIVVQSPTFTGNRREVTVQVNVQRVAERGTLVTGRLEINTPDIRDKDGGALSSGDRWFIECSVTVLPRPGHLVVRAHARPDDPPIMLTGRKGQTITETLAIVNDGEVEIEYSVQDAGAQAGGTADGLSVTISPAQGALAPGAQAQVSLEVETNALAAGTYQTALTLRTTAGQTVSVPLSVRPLSALDFLKSKMKRG